MKVAFRITPLWAALVLSLATGGCHRVDVLGEDTMNAGAGAGMGAGMSGSTSGEGGAGMGGSGGVTKNPDDMMPDDMMPDDMMPDDMMPDSCWMTQVAVGVDNTCAVTADGALYCWGRDVSTDESITEPEQVTAIMGEIRSVALGAGHICALVEQGYVWCWGSNGRGQLGNGSHENQEHPVLVSDLSDVEQIDAGFAHTCAVKGNGEVWCWGDNRLGQLGEGAEVVRSPVALWARAERAVQVSAGLEHTCIRDNNDRVHCIGSNTHGQLGNGTTASSSDWVSIDFNASDVSAGFYHTCAVADDSFEVWCWGGNSAGQLGDGTNTGSIDGMPTGHASPVFALDVQAPTTVHAALDHTCVAPLMGSVKCWGSNQFGALGYGPGEEIGEFQYSPTEATLVEPNVMAYAAGGSHSCAIYGNGELVCWGANGFGAVGDGTVENRYEPVTISGFACD